MINRSNYGEVTFNRFQSRQQIQINFIVSLSLSLSLSLSRSSNVDIYHFLFCIHEKPVRYDVVIVIY